MDRLHVARAIALAAVIVGAFAASAPGQPAPSRLRGTIRDESGAVLPGVTVTVTDTRSAAVATAVTDRVGTFTLALDAGSFDVRAELTGFRRYDSVVAIGAGDTRTLDMVLEIAPLSVTETVTVTRAEQDRSDVPNAVSVIDADALQVGQRKATAAEAFAGTPGMFVESRNNFSQSGGIRMTIRAPLPSVGMRGIQLVQDGIPLTVADGTTQPNNVDLGSAGRVEIIRGPSSVLYGNAAGGVVSVNTEFPQAGRVTVEPDVQIGSFGYQREQVKLEGLSGRMGYVANVSRLAIDGYRQHSAADVRQANAVVRAQLSPATELRGVFNLSDLPFSENSSTLARADALAKPTTVRQQAFDQGWGESSTQGQGGATIEHRLSDHGSLSATGWAMWRNVWNPIPSRIVNLGRTAGGFRSEYRDAATIGAVPLEWTTGFDLSSQHDDRAEFQNLGVAVPGARTREGAPLVDQLEQVRSLGPFVQINVPFAARWRVIGGARYDYYHFDAIDHLLVDGDQSGSRTMDALSPMVGIAHTAADWLNLYANFATAYTTPTTVELSNKPTGEGGFNQDLKPQDLRSYEIGARGVVDAWRIGYEASVYVSRLTNAFVALQRPDEQTYYVNAGESTRDGIELLVEWTPTPRLKTRASFTGQDFRFRTFATPQGNYAGLREPGVAPHQAFASATYAAPFGVRATGQIRWVDAYPVDNANRVANWAYSVVDLRFVVDRKWKRGAVRPYVGVDNLFNERYNSSVSVNAVANRFYEPAPGRALYLGLTVGVGPL